jgi:nucleosome binding factor SPN SPT16 subunit
VTLEIILKSKVPKENFAHYDTMLAACKADAKSNSNSLILGHVKKDVAKPMPDTLCKNFLKKVRAMAADGDELVLRDVASGLSRAMAVQDAAGASCTENAALFAATVLRKVLLPKIEDVLDSQKPVTHEALSEFCEDAFANPRQAGIKIKKFLQSDATADLEVVYSPIIMSGGSYNLKPSAFSNTENLHDGTIVCVLGARYRSFCSNVGRTYFVNPTPTHKAAYALLLDVYRACCAALVPGKMGKDVYAAAMATTAASKTKEMASHFTKNCGFLLGTEFRDSSFVLSATSPRRIEPGMVFNLCIGFDNLSVKSDKSELKSAAAKRNTFAVLVADTVIVREDDCEPLTNVARKYSEVAYFLGDEMDEDEDDSEEEETEMTEKKRVASTRGKTGPSPAAAEQDRAERQAKLETRKAEEALKRFAMDTIDKQFDANAVDAKDTRFSSYSDPSAFPRSARTNRIYVDTSKESILVPIAGQHVPFHIRTVKNVHKFNQEDHIVLQINFKTPETAATQLLLPAFADQKAKYIRELTFRSKGESLGQVFFEMKELRKRVMNRMKEHEAKESIVVQPNLVIDQQRGAFASLKEVQLRPSVHRRKAVGKLSAHVNGFRYKDNLSNRVDITYSNIKHAFFAPADNTISVVIHFELKNAIIVGKKGKPTTYVQVYVDVIDSSQDVGGSRNNDADGLLEEQQERRNRSRWNDKFHKFVKHVETYLSKTPDQPTLEFDIPYKELQFKGVPNKETVEVTPTVHALVALTDNPPCVIPLEDIEIVNLERVSYELKNFDMAVVYKDLKKAPTTIFAIPMKQLDNIKKWLERCEILYYTSRQNILWKNVMKTIVADPKGFYEDGGWKIIFGDDEDSDDGDGSAESVSESGSEFDPGSMSEDSEEFATDSEEYSEEESEEESSEVSDDDDHSWEALAKEAKSHDKKRQRVDAITDSRERSRKKQKRKR